MVGVRVEGDPGTDVVECGTAVRVVLRGLSGGVKRRVWRDRQVQAEAYNWGVEYALTAHNRGERIPSPRQYSVPLTRFRHESGSVHSVLLRRGGFWCAVGAVKEWSKRRDQLVHGQREAVEGTDNAFAGLGALLEKLAAGSDGVRWGRCRCTPARWARRWHSVGALIGVVSSWSSAARTLLCVCGRPHRTLRLSAMPADERAERIAEAVEGSDKALESFNAAMKTLRAATNSATGTKAARERLRGLADKVHAAAAAEAKAGKRLLAHVARGRRSVVPVPSRRRAPVGACSGGLRRVHFQRRCAEAAGRYWDPVAGRVRHHRRRPGGTPGREADVERGGACRGRDRQSGQGHPPHRARAPQIPCSFPVPRLRCCCVAGRFARAFFGH